MNTKIEATVQDLERIYEGIDEENNEWKVRHSLQIENNDHLEKNTEILQNKVNQAKDFLNEVRGAKGSVDPYNLGDITHFTIRRMEKSRKQLKSELHGLEWKLDHESRAYYKARDDAEAMAMQSSALLISMQEIQIQKQRNIDRELMGSFETSRRSPRRKGPPSPSQYLTRRQILLRRQQQDGQEGKYVDPMNTYRVQNNRTVRTERLNRSVERRNDDRENHPGNSSKNGTSGSYSEREGNRRRVKSDPKVLPPIENKENTNETSA